MKNQPLVLVGAAIVLVGMAVLVNGWSNISPNLYGGPVGIADALIPGRWQGPQTSQPASQPAGTKAAA